MSLEAEKLNQEFEVRSLGIDDYKKRIEITDAPNGYPTIEVSDATKKFFPDFVKSIEDAGENKEPIIFAVVRCWNKDEKSVSEMLDRVGEIKKSLPDLKGVILSINYDQDKDNMTENSLVEVSRQRELDVPVLPLRIKGYSWTSGLNVGVSLVNEIAKEKQIDLETIKMLGMSFDVNIEKEEVEKMEELSSKQRYVFTVRKTSEDTAPFELDQNKLWEKFKTMMREPMNSNLFELVYAMRNTLGLIPLNDLVDFGGFNPLCDGRERPLRSGNKTYSIKGMEDSEFYMRLFLDALKNKKIKIIREFKRSLGEPVVYNDPSWQRIGEVDRFKKISNETDALNKIVNNLAQSMGDSKINKISGEQQDFRIEN